MNKLSSTSGLWILAIPGGILLAGRVSEQAIYEEDAVPTRLGPGQAVSARVSAAVEAWRDTGVDLEAGAECQLTADGKRSTYGTCNFTGPDGAGLYNALRPNSSLFPPVLSAYSHSTLIGKIG